MRSTRWAAVAAAVALSVTAGCAGVDATTDPGAADNPSSVDDATESAPPERAADDTQESESTEAAEAETTEPPAEVGTRQNPATVDDVGTFSTGVGDEIRVTLGAATWDANAIVAGENQFNDPPADGMVFVILPVTVGYTGPDSVLPWIDIDITYLAGNGRSYEQAYGVIPEDLSDVADIYDGGTATGNVLFEVPADQVPGGMWGVSYNWSDELWWTAS
ncbi:hypothetical protein [Pseudactinotalea terrae]|uniref:hypothetical protein n=1 Tax=Pseudactinotalea terrae TaxID=1743262 RepID=UPI0012E2D2E6|nr:hypothetical protein [Pseudactinotalea terrae]